MKKYHSALITGGSSGIGLALAKQLASEGVNVCLLARDEVKLRKAQQEVASLVVHKKQRVDILVCDITNFENVHQTLEQWTSQSGVPDLVINSAGAVYPGYFEELDIEVFHALMDVNYFGTLHVLAYFIPKMIAQQSGTVVNLASQAGFVGVFGYSAYGPTKYAVRGLSDVLRAEMKPHKIQVSIVFPPDTQTPQLDFEAPLKPPETKAIAGKSKILSPEHVAKTILKDVRKGRYVIIPGLEGKVFFRLINLLGNLVYPLMDLIISGAQKKTLPE